MTIKHFHPSLGEPGDRRKADEFLNADKVAFDTRDVSDDLPPWERPLAHFSKITRARGITLAGEPGHSNDKGRGYRGRVLECVIYDELSRWDHLTILDNNLDLSPDGQKKKCDIDLLVRINRPGEPDRAILAKTSLRERAVSQWDRAAQNAEKDYAHLIRNPEKRELRVRCLFYKEKASQTVDGLRKLAATTSSQFYAITPRNHVWSICDPDGMKKFLSDLEIPV